MNAQLPARRGLLDRSPLAAGLLAAAVAMAVTSALVAVALLAPLLERCPWEKGRRFVMPGAHRGGTRAWSMRAEVRTKPFGVAS